MSVFSLPPKHPTSTFAKGVALAAICATLTACGLKPILQSEEEKTSAAKAEQARQAMRPSTVCSPQQGNPFAMRKKVLVLALPVQKPIEAVDLPGLASAWSNALQQRMQKSDRYLIRNGSNHAINPNDDLRKQITALAQQYDAQIVIAGQITSLGMHHGRIGLGSLGSLPQPFGDMRVIETELDVYDGHTGTRLKRLQHETDIQGEVKNTSGSTLRGDFFRIPLGIAVNSLLERQMEDLQDELACLPLQARIVLTAEKEVHIDAGYTSNMKPGDRLRILQREGFPSSEGVQSEKTVGHLVIKKVHPETAVGQVEGEDQPDWKLNGFIRAW
jgi:hypothetical protein